MISLALIEGISVTINRYRNTEDKETTERINLNKKARFRASAFGISKNNCTFAAKLNQT